MTDTASRPAAADLPDLPEPVGIAGSSHRVELGGTVCFGLIIATINSGLALDLGAEGF